MTVSGTDIKAILVEQYCIHYTKIYKIIVAMMTRQ
jgi:hypothetical protein